MNRLISAGDLAEGMVAQVASRVMRPPPAMCRTNRRLRTITAMWRSSMTTVVCVPWTPIGGRKRVNGSQFGDQACRGIDRSGLVVEENIAALCRDNRRVRVVHEFFAEQLT